LNQVIAPVNQNTKAGDDAEAARAKAAVEKEHQVAAALAASQAPVKKARDDATAQRSTKKKARL
jgi:hypothetical protein